MCILYIMRNIISSVLGHCIERSWLNDIVLVWRFTVYVSFRSHANGRGSKSYAIWQWNFVLSSRAEPIGDKNDVRSSVTIHNPFDINICIYILYIHICRYIYIHVYIYTEYIYVQIEREKKREREGERERISNRLVFGALLVH